MQLIIFIICGLVLEDVQGCCLQLFSAQTLLLVYFFSNIIPELHY